MCTTVRIGLHRGRYSPSLLPLLSSLTGQYRPLGLHTVKLISGKESNQLMQDYYGLGMINHANIGLVGWKPVNNNNIPLHVEIADKAI